MATKRKSFTAILEPDGTALKWVIARVPFDVAKAWPERRGNRVRGEIEGFAFRTSLFPDPKDKARSGGRVVLVNKTMQKAAGAYVGQKVKIWLEPDLEERETLMPPELERLLKQDRGLKKWFETGMSDSMRREIGKWCDQPKGAATREKRAEKIAERMMQAMEGEKTPPPILKVLFQRYPGAEEAWLKLTPAQRRGHLMGIFYYETVEARERRAEKAVAEALERRGPGTRDRGNY